MHPEIWFPNLGIIIEKLERVAFNAFGLPIYWYGIIMVTAILTASAYVMLEAKRTGQNVDLYYDMAIFGIAGGIIGARLYYVIFSWEYYKDNLLKIFAFREGGLALYGSILGGALVVVIYTRVKKLDFLLFTDTIAPGFILAQAIGRWGNFINREAFGGFTENLFAMRYQAADVPYIPNEVLNTIMLIEDVPYIQVHPTFLYECVWNLIGFLILFLFRNKKKFNGQLTAMYFIIYGAGRIWIEGLRTDQLQIGNTGIAVSQVLSGVFIVLAVIFIIYNIRKPQVSASIDGAEDIAINNEDEHDERTDSTDGV